MWGRSHSRRSSLVYTVLNLGTHNFWQTTHVKHSVNVYIIIVFCFSFCQRCPFGTSNFNVVLLYVLPSVKEGVNMLKKWREVTKAVSLLGMLSTWRKTS